MNFYRYCYCEACGKYIGDKKGSYGGLCQGCYTYFRKGGVVHEIPKKGRIEFDPEGKVICHICGRSYTKLGAHVKESHHMTISEYKEEFGLCTHSKTTERSYSSKMSQYALKYNMDEQLKIVGKDTRIKKGDTHLRKNKPVRLQECLDKSNRRKKDERSKK